MSGCKAYLYPIIMMGYDTRKIPKKNIFTFGMRNCFWLDFIMNHLIHRVHNSSKWDIYCCVPPSQGLQVMVAWGHGWKASKLAGTAHWLKPPTYWSTKNTPNRILVLTIKLPTNNIKYTLVYTDRYKKNLNGVGLDNIKDLGHFRLCYKRGWGTFKCSLTKESVSVLGLSLTCYKYFFFFG